MMKKKVFLLALIVAVAFVFFSVASLASGPAKGNFAGKPGMPNCSSVPEKGFSGKSYAQPFQNGELRGIMNLDLSEEQVAKIRQIMLDFQKETLELRNQIQLKQLEMRELRLAPEVDLNQVRTKLEEIAALQVELRIKAFERQEKVKEILTPEQLSNFGLGFPMQRSNAGNMRNNNFNQGCKGNRW